MRSEVWLSVGSSCVFRLLKTLLWQAGFPCRACQLPGLIMFPSCWLRAKAYRQQVVILSDRFQWPSVRCFPVNQRLFFCFKDRAEWGGDDHEAARYRLVPGPEQINKRSDYFSTHDSANSEWIKGDPAHSTDKLDPRRSRPPSPLFS